MGKKQSGFIKLNTLKPLQKQRLKNIKKWQRKKADQQN